jgi:molybdopterin synthase catalytic subunit
LELPEEGCVPERLGVAGAEVEAAHLFITLVFITLAIVRGPPDTMAAVSEPVLTRVSADPLSVEEALAFIADPGAGGTCVFIGTVRDRSDAGEVTGLHYEAWDDLATGRLGEIAQEMLDRWPLRRVAILHRTGDLAIGEASVVVACSAPHRAEAFEACRHGIERLKEDVPIWKKEGLVSGDARWVMGS